MSENTQRRIISLQAQLKITKDALGKIVGGCRNPEGVAEEALYDLQRYIENNAVPGVIPK